MKKALFILASIITLAFEIQAQQDPMYTQYMFNQLAINPAYAGSKDKATAMVLYRTQWVGFDGAPKTTSLTGHAPIFGQRSSVGATLIQDKIGISNNIYLSGSYAYRIDFKKFRVAAGLSAEVKRQQMNWSLANPIIPVDPNIPFLNSNLMLPNFGAGLYIDSDKFYVGIATPRMLQNKLDYTNGVGTATQSAKQARHYYLTGGFIMNISKDVKFKPAALVKYTDNSPLEIDINGSFLFAEKFWLGATYRTGDSFDIIAQFIVGNMRIGYGFDYSTTQLNRYNMGTHEILISMDFQTKVKGIHHPRYF